MNQTAQQAAEQYVKDCDPAEILSLEEGKIVSDAFQAGWEAGQPKWIPVTERLPEQMQSCLFIVDSNSEHDNGRVLGGTYIGNPDQDWSKYEFSTPGVGWKASHWCPIPDSLLNFKP